CPNHSCPLCIVASTLSQAATALAHQQPPLRPAPLPRATPPWALPLLATALAGDASTHRLPSYEQPFASRWQQPLQPDRGRLLPLAGVELQSATIERSPPRSGRGRALALATTGRPFAGGLGHSRHPLASGQAVASHLCMQTSCRWSPLARRQHLLLLPNDATNVSNSSTHYNLITRSLKLIFRTTTFALIPLLGNLSGSITYPAKIKTKYWFSTHIKSSCKILGLQEKWKN
ncbi:hypothetical protein BHE74_00051771, partial [Ensete ventricosum]